MLVKPMNTHDLLTQLEALLAGHEAKKQGAVTGKNSGKPVETGKDALAQL